MLLYGMGVGEIVKNQRVTRVRIYERSVKFGSYKCFLVKCDMFIDELRRCDTLSGLRLLKFWVAPKNSAWKSQFWSRETQHDQKGDGNSKSAITFDVTRRNHEPRVRIPKYQPCLVADYLGPIGRTEPDSNSALSLGSGNLNLGARHSSTLKTAKLWIWECQKRYLLFCIPISMRIVGIDTDNAKLRI